MKTVKEQWESFVSQVLPDGCSQVQYTEMRRAFYAGAFSMLRTVHDVGGMDEGGAIVALEALSSEIDRFYATIGGTDEGQ